MDRSTVKQTCKNTVNICVSLVFKHFSRGPKNCGIQWNTIEVQLTPAILVLVEREGSITRSKTRKGCKWQSKHTGNDILHCLLNNYPSNASNS